VLSGTENRADCQTQFSKFCAQAAKYVFSGEFTSLKTSILCKQLLESTIIQLIVEESAHSPGGWNVHGPSSQNVHGPGSWNARGSRALDDIMGASGYGK